MLALLAAASLTAPLPAERKPATTLAAELAESLAALVPTITVVTDESVTEEERHAVVTALERTGLFGVVDGGAAGDLELSRTRATRMEVEVKDPDGKLLWHRSLDWPEKKVRPAPPLDAETRRRRIATWRSQRLRVVATERLVLHAPFSDPQVADFFSASSRAGSDPTEWTMSYAGSPPTSSLPVDWVIVRGASEVIDDVRLAELLEDRDLAQRIRAERDAPRLWWILGLSATAAAGVTSGAVLVGNDDRDLRTLGASLLTAGAVAAAIAALTPWLRDADHVLTAAEAGTLAELHNERLRRQLGLEPTEVER
jgi:hypothetical protein